MAEDSPTDAKLVIQELRATGRAVDLERIETAEAMRIALETSTWDVILSDWSMPKFSAMDALEVLKKSGLDLPFIIVSGTIGEESAVDAMRAGAHDYVLKDKLARLAPAIERELRECRDRAAHRESEIGRAAIVEYALDAIVGMDHTGTITDFNPAAERTFGYSRAEALGQPLAELLVPEAARHAHRAGLEKFLSTGLGPVIGKRIEVTALRADGTEIPVELAVSRIGAVVPPRFMGFLRDLSEHKRAEAGRMRAEEALRRSEVQLRQAQKMEAIGRLAGGVAHDFNNILSVILSYGDLIVESLEPGDPMRADMEEIRKAGSRAASLTRQLLTFSRQQVVEPKIIDLHEILGSTERMLQRILGEDIELTLVAPASSGRVRADPSHIEQVILNIVFNARDAMPTGGKLTIETADVTLGDDYMRDHFPSKAGQYVMMAITDTGAGMDRETQARIFEPFFTTKSQEKGTGLGLSTVFGIVQQSGGNIWVYSELGRGTTFKIYLPRVDAQASLPAPAPVAPTTLRGTETILLVEDETQVRMVVMSILLKHGYHVMPAQHAGEALLLCESHSGTIDLLLTDVVMPQMSGPELAKRLSSSRPQMKVLCMSGYTDDSVVRHGVLESGVAFLQKPVTPASLARKVREVLDQPLDNHAK
ncbi:MAG TPA: response regulator [Polyangiaceae bacterium]|nr:response regulator [Polyangiaceae bacterium]